MAITREQVADLQPGDVIELRFESGSIVRGALTDSEWYGPGLGIADAGWPVRDRHEEPRTGAAVVALEVVSRVPRPLYVNHPRTEPVPGDVVRDADNESDNTVWMMDFGVDTEGVWCPPTGVDSFSRAELPARLRLLVDGETGQVVQ